MIYFYILNKTIILFYKMTTIKKDQTFTQKNEILKKKIVTSNDKDVPTYKNVMQYRTEQLLMQFMQHNSDITKPLITLKDFCHKHKISQSTLRKAMKDKCNSSIRDSKNNTNNIGKYQKEKKSIMTKILINGESSLNEEEKVKLNKYREIERKRIEKITNSTKNLKLDEVNKNKDFINNNDDFLTDNESNSQEDKNDIIQKTRNKIKKRNERLNKQENIVDNEN